MGGQGVAVTDTVNLSEQGLYFAGIQQIGIRNVAVLQVLIALQRCHFPPLSGSPIFDQGSISSDQLRVNGSLFLWVLFPGRLTVAHLGKPLLHNSSIYLVTVCL